MKNICDMLLTDCFKLSTGHIALVGRIEPNLDELLTECKAYLYIDNKKIRSIGIIGEDKFLRVNEAIRQHRRSVRTNDDIYDEIKANDKKQIKLVFYKD